MFSQVNSTSQIDNLPANTKNEYDIDKLYQGVKITLINLQNKKSLNGKTGTVIGFSKKKNGRLNIQIHGTKMCVGVQFKNIKFVSSQHKSQRHVLNFHFIHLYLWFIHLHTCFK